MSPSTDVILFSSTFRHARTGDHVEEVKFDVPVCITQIQISDASSGEQGPPPLLRLYARDSYIPSSSRYAQLCNSMISCGDSSTTSTFKTEAVVTDHVVIRGRYVAIELSLLGSLDHDPATARKEAGTSGIQAKDMEDLEKMLPKQQEGTKLPLGQASLLNHHLGSNTTASALVLPPALPPSITGPLPLLGLPPDFVHAVQQGLDYFAVVQRSHKRICTNPPYGRLVPLMEVADSICDALQGQPGGLLNILSHRVNVHTPAGVSAAGANNATQASSHFQEQSPLWISQAVDMAVSWCSLLTSRLTFTQVEITVGLAGISAALALCSYPKTCAEFLVSGGLGVVVDLLSMDRPPAEILRFSLSLCEIVIVSGAAAGCEALLGWWAPPLPKPKPALMAPPPPPPPAKKLAAKKEKEDEDPGSSSVKLVQKNGSPDEEMEDALGKVANVDDVMTDANEAEEGGDIVKEEGGDAGDAAEQGGEEESDEDDRDAREEEAAAAAAQGLTGDVEDGDDNERDAVDDGGCGGGGEEGQDPSSRNAEEEEADPLMQDLMQNENQDKEDDEDAEEDANKEDDLSDVMEDGMGGVEEGSHLTVGPASGQLHLDDDGDGGLRVPSTIEGDHHLTMEREEVDGGEDAVQVQLRGPPSITCSREPSVTNRDEDIHPLLANDDEDYLYGELDSEAITPGPASRLSSLNPATSLPVAAATVTDSGDHGAGERSRAVGVVVQRGASRNGGKEEEDRDTVNDVGDVGNDVRGADKEGLKEYAKSSDSKAVSEVEGTALILSKEKQAEKGCEDSSPSKIRKSGVEEQPRVERVKGGKDKDTGRRMRSRSDSPASKRSSRAGGSKRMRSRSRSNSRDRRRSKRSSSPGRRRDDDGKMEDLRGSKAREQDAGAEDNAGRLGSVGRDGGRRLISGSGGDSRAMPAGAPGALPGYRRGGLALGIGSTLQQQAVRDAYSPLVRIVGWRTHAPPIALLAARVLQRLQAYEAIAKFSSASAKLVRSVAASTAAHTAAAAAAGTVDSDQAALSGPNSNKSGDGALPAQGTSTEVGSGGNNAVPPQLTLIEAFQAVREAVTYLSELPGLCLLTMQRDRLPQPASGSSTVIAAMAANSSSLHLGSHASQVPPRLDPVVLVMLTQRDIFHVAAGLMHAIAALNAQIKISGVSSGSRSRSQQQAIKQQAQQQAHQLAQLHGQGVAALRTLTTVLMSTPFSLRACFGMTSGINNNSIRASIAALAHALDPNLAPGEMLCGAGCITDGSAGWISSGGKDAAGKAAGGLLSRGSIAASLRQQQAAADQQRPPPAAELAVLLKEVLVAQAAASSLESSLPGSQEASSAVYSLAGAVSSTTTLSASLPSCSAPRQAAVLALSAAPGAVRVLLQLMRARVRVLAAAFGPVSSGGVANREGTGGAGGNVADMSGTSVAKRESSMWSGEDEDDLEDDGRPVYQLESLYAHSVVLELVRECQPDIFLGWAPQASAIAEASRAELEAITAHAAANSTGVDGLERERRALREIIGRAEVAVAFQERGLFGIFSVLDGALPHLVAKQEGGSKRSEKDVDIRDALAAARSPDVSARISSALTLLSQQLSSASGTIAKQLVLQAYGTGGTILLERALRTANHTLISSAADSQWSSLAGDFVDDADRLRNHRSASSLACTASRAASAFVIALAAIPALSSSESADSAASTSSPPPPVPSPCGQSFLAAMLSLHSRLCVEPECLAAALGSAKGPSETTHARSALSMALGVWTDASWQPSPLPYSLGARPTSGLQIDLSPLDTGKLEGTGGAVSGTTGAGDVGGSGLNVGSREPSSCSQSPGEMYASACLLGDLLPPEWPQQQQAPAAAVAKPGAGAPGGAAATAASKESAGAGNKGAPAAAAAPGSTFMPESRESTIRRSSLSPLLEQCQQQLRRLIAFGASSESRLMRSAIVRVCARAAGLGPTMGVFLAQPLLEQIMAIIKGSGPIADGRRVLEMLVPLSAKPAMKAGLLELKATSTLSRYLHKLVHKLSDEGAEGPTALTMCLECLTLLCNPDVALNPTLSLEQRLVEDCPSLPECAALVAAVLACMPTLGGSASMARGLLNAPTTGLATHVMGRAAIRQGAAKWYLTQTAGSGAGAARIDSEQQRTALAWAAGKLRDCGERMKTSAATSSSGSASSTLATAALDVAAALDKVSQLTDDDSAVPAAAAPESLAARYAAAREASVKSVDSSGKLPPAGAAAAESKCSLSAAAIVTCPVTVAFWRYCRARGSARTALLGRKLTKFEAGGSALLPPSASQLFTEGLTKKKRARENKQLQDGAASAAATTIRRAAAAAAKQGGAGAAVQAPGGGEVDGSDADIPSVVAPRRPAGVRLRGATGRPASMHVDDYQRTGNPSAIPVGAPPSKTAMPPPISLAPPQSNPVKKQAMQQASSAATQLQSFDSDALYSDLFTPKTSAAVSLPSSLLQQPSTTVDVFSISGLPDAPPANRMQQQQGKRPIASASQQLLQAHGSSSSSSLPLGTNSSLGSPPGVQQRLPPQMSVDPRQQQQQQGTPTSRPAAQQLQQQQAPSPPAAGKPQDLMQQLLAVLTDPVRLRAFVEHYPDVIRKIVATQPALGAMLQQRLGNSMQLPQ